MAITPLERIEIGRFRLTYEHDLLAPAMARLLATRMRNEEKTRRRVTMGPPIPRVFL